MGSSTHLAQARKINLLIYSHPMDHASLAGNEMGTVQDRTRLLEVVDDI